MSKKILGCTILVLCMLLSSCSNKNTVTQKTNTNTGSIDTKSNVEAELNQAKDKITELESTIEGDKGYIDELQKEIELANSFTKKYPVKEQLAIAKMQWHYSLKIDDKKVSGNTVEVDKTDFQVDLSEGHDALPLVPMDVFNNGRISGDTKEHIKFSNYKPSDMMEPAGGNVWGYVYEFKNVPHGTNIEMKISKELQERIGVNNNIINIKVK